MDFRKEDFYVEINKNSNEAWDSANDELSDIITRGETNGQTPEELLTELQEQFIEMGQLSNRNAENVVGERRKAKNCSKISKDDG